MTEIEVLESRDIPDRYSLSYSSYMQAKWIENALEFLEWIGESIDNGAYPPPLNEMESRIEELESSAA